MAKTITNIVGTPAQRAALATGVISPTSLSFVEVTGATGLWVVSDILYKSSIPSPSPKIQIFFALDSAGLTKSSDSIIVEPRTSRNTNRVDMFDITDHIGAYLYCAAQLVNGQGIDVEAYVALVKEA